MLTSINQGVNYHYRQKYILVNEYIISEKFKASAVDWCL